MPKQVLPTIRNDLLRGSAATVASFGVYLGLQVGPGRIGQVWHKALSKFEARADMWSSLGLGLQLNARVYHIFVTSVLSYISQVCELSNDILA